MRLIRWVTLVVVVMAAGLFAAVPGAAAHAASPAFPTPPCFPSYKPMNSHVSIPRSDNFKHGIGWSVSGPGGGTLSLSRDVSSSNSFTSSFGLSASDVSATVGFNVTETVTQHAGYSYTPPDKGDGVVWTLTAGTRDVVYVYDVHQFCGNIDQGVTGKGWATRTGDLIYEVHGERPGNPYNPGGGAPN